MDEEGSLEVDQVCLVGTTGRRPFIFRFWVRHANGMGMEESGGIKYKHEMKKKPGENAD